MQTNNKEDCTITLSNIANFLSIDESIIEKIDQVSTTNECLITLVLKPKIEYCPFCGSYEIESKGRITRKIKHALFLDRQTIFNVKIKRYVCRDCQKTFSDLNPFSAKHSRITHAMTYKILKDLSDCSITFRSEATLLSTSVTTIQNIFDKYVNPRRRSLPTVLSIDECYNKRLFNDPYSCILFDFLNCKIVDVIMDRSKHSIGRYFQIISEDERRNVRFTVIDMWEPYKQISQYYFPKAIIAVDSFHVMENLVRALKNLRSRIRKRYPKNSREYYLLKTWAFLLFQSPDPLAEKKFNRKLDGFYNLHDIKIEMLNVDEDYKKAAKYYDEYRHFNSRCSYKTAKTRIDYFIYNTELAEIAEIHEFQKTLENWKTEIVNSFIVVEQRRLSNGPIEGFNSMFKRVLFIGNGYLNFQRFRNRVMHCYNKEFTLTPVSSKIKKISVRKSHNKKPKL